MNYIKHLSSILEKFNKDDRLNPTHVSLYLALFQYWNISRFSSPLSISRNEIMNLSKISSFATYHKCIKDLHNWEYIEYLPSHNPFKGSKVILLNFHKSTEQVIVHKSSDNKQALVHKNSDNEQALVHKNSDNEQALVHKSSDNEQALVSYKTNINYKQIKHKTSIYINFENIKKYFLKNKSSEAEAEKFFNYYESTGWKIGGKAEMKNWQAAARNWIIKSKEIKEVKTKKADVQKLNKLHINNDKDYGIPL